MKQTALLKKTSSRLFAAFFTLALLFASCQIYTDDSEPPAPQKENAVGTIPSVHDGKAYLSILLSSTDEVLARTLEQIPSSCRSRAL